MSSTARSTNGESAKLPSPGVNNTPQKDDPLAKEIERLSNRLLVAEELVRLKDEQLKTKDERLAVKDERIKVLEEQKANSAKESSLRQEARTIDLERIGDRDKIIAKQDAEIARLRNPGFFGTLFNPQFLKGGIVGYGACKLVNSFGGERQVLSLATGSSSFIPQFSFTQPYPLGVYSTPSEDRLREALKLLKR